LTRSTPKATGKWHPTDSKVAVVHLATSADGLRGVMAAITATPLLPDEDPSLLTGRTGCRHTGSCHT
jgi:hypothetical protein